MTKFQTALIMVTATLALMLIAGSSDAKYKIAVVDSGFNQLSLFTNHVPLCKNGHYNLITKRNDLGFDEIGHGTAVTKLIEDNLDPKNRKNRCFMVYKVFGGLGITSSDMVAKGIYLAARRGARVINLSLGGPAIDYKVKRAIRFATKRGIRVFVAAGNESINLNENCSTYPACMKIKNMYVVGALERMYTTASYSNYGRKVDLWEIGYAYGMQGTSFAAPRATARYVREVLQ